MHQRYSPRLDARLPCESHSLDAAMILHGRIAAFLIYAAAASHPVCYIPGSACFCFMKRDGGSWSFVININMISALDTARYCSNYGNLRLWHYLLWMRISRKLHHYMGRVSMEFVLFESYVHPYWVWSLSWCSQQPSINTWHPCLRASIAVVGNVIVVTILEIIYLKMLSSLPFSDRESILEEERKLRILNLNDKKI